MTDPAGAKEYKLSRAYSYYLFTLLFLLYLFNYVDRVVVTSLFPFIQKDWGLTDTQCGMLVSVVFMAIVTLTFPASVVVDRWSRKKTIGIMALLWSFATAVCAFTKSFPQLLVARTGIGIGEAGFAPGGTAMLSGLFPPEQRSRMVGMWNASIPLGSAIGIGLGGIIAETWGWRHAFGIVAVPGAIVAVLFFFIKDYKTVQLVKTIRTESEEARKVSMSKADIFRDFVRTPSLLLTNIGFAGVIFTTTSILTWLPTYYHRLENLPMSQAGMKTGLIMILAIIGGPLGGWLTDVWFRRRASARLLFPAISTLLTAVTLFTALVLLEGRAQYAAMLLMGVLIVAFAPAAITVTQEVIHPGLRAISYAVCVIFQNALGASTAPIVVGALSDAYGIRAAMSVLPSFLVFSAVLFYLGSRYYERDLEKVEKVQLEMES
jgi:MFS family permease